MEGSYRGVFSWPSQAWIKRDKSEEYDTDHFIPKDIGVELAESDHGTELMNMITHSMDNGQDEPVCVFDMDSVVIKYRHWMKCFPRIRPYFAVKVYDDPAVISLLDHLGAGFDCASKSEIDLVVRKLNVDPNNIIYANAIKAPTHIAFAVNNGVTLMTFDCEEELLKIKMLFPEARLLLRLSPLQIGDVEWPLSQKFGCSQKDISHLFQFAKELSLNIVGVCFHAGSGIDDARAYVANIEAARAAFDVGEKMGFKLDLLDIGGGFYGNKGAEDKLEKMCGPMTEAIDKYFPLDSGVSIISEPGRYFVESGLKMAACVIGKKTLDINQCKETVETHKKSTGPTNKCHDNNAKRDAAFEYYISSSVFGILNMNVYFNNYDYHPVPFKKNKNKGDYHVAVLWGPSCDSIDKIQPNHAQPELDRGDWLIFNDVGAYSVSVSTTFNGFSSCESVRRIMHPRTWKSIFHNANIIRNGVHV